jgi:hypothetical protein
MHFDALSARNRAPASLTRSQPGTHAANLIVRDYLHAEKSDASAGRQTPGKRRAMGVGLHQIKTKASFRLAG